MIISLSVLAVLTRDNKPMYILYQKTLECYQGNRASFPCFESFMYKSKEKIRVCGTLCEFCYY